MFKNPSLDADGADDRGRAGADEGPDEAARHPDRSFASAVAVWRLVGARSGINTMKSNFDYNHTIVCWNSNQNQVLKAF